MKGASLIISRWSRVVVGEAALYCKGLFFQELLDYTEWVGPVVGEAVLHRKGLFVQKLLRRIGRIGGLGSFGSCRVEPVTCSKVVVSKLSMRSILWWLEVGKPLIVY